MNAQTLSSWVTDEEARAKYVEAFQRSNFAAMLNYYKRNYPDIWGGTAELVTSTMRSWLDARRK
jgi:hypothetical protein